MSPNKYPQLILLGDSLIQYASLLRDGFSFISALDEHCQRRLDVVNRGLSGYNTANELVILHDLLPLPDCAKVDYVLVMFGTNDACLPGTQSGQHVSLEDFKKNMKTILTHPSITVHAPIILLVTPPPIHEVHLSVLDKARQSLLTRKQRVTAQYAAAVREVAAELQHVLLLDLWKAMMERAKTTEGQGVFAEEVLLGTIEAGYSEGLRRLLVDGVHFTGEGYKILFDLVKPVVGQAWPREPLEKQSWVFPHWSAAPRIDQVEH